MIKFINNAGSSKAKISNTVEELPTTGKEKDLAVVYREEIQPFQESTQTQVITFPDTVVLDEAFTGNVRGMLRSVDPSKMFDGNVMLDPNMFRFDGFGETEMIRVEYRSTDGITYTRNRMQGNSGDLTNPVDLGTVVKLELSEPFNPVIGNFMQIGGNVFEGLLEYAKIQNADYLYFTTNISQFPPYYEYSKSEEINSVITAFMNKLLPLYTENYQGILIYDKNNQTITLYKDLNQMFGLVNSDNTTELYFNGGTYSSAQTISKTWEKIVYNITTNTISKSTVTSSGTSEYPHPGALYSDNIYIVNEIIDTSNFFAKISIQPSEKTYDLTNGYIAYNVSNYKDNIASEQINLKAKVGEIKTWVNAPNQFTLKQSNQLLPGVIGYGKNGEITGDESIYSNINVTEMLENLGISPYNNSLVLANEGTHIIPCNQYDAGVEIINYLGVLKTNFKPNSNIQKRSIYLVGDYIMIFNPNGIAYWYDMNLNLIASHKGEGSASSIQVKSVFTDSNKYFFSTQNYNNTNNVDIYSIDKNGMTSNKTYTVEGKLNYAIMSDGIIYAVSTNSNHIFLYKLLETGEAELVLSQDTTSQVYDAELFQDENYIYVTAINFAQYSFYNKKDNTSGFKTFNYSVSLYQGLDNRIYLAELSKFSKLEGSNIEEVTVPFFPSNVSMGIYDLSKNTIISYSGVTNMEPTQILLYNSENSGHQVVPNLSDNKNRLSTFRGKFNGSKFIGIRTEAAFTQDTQEYRIYSSEITFDKKVIQEYQLNAIPILKLNDLSNLHLALGNIGNYTF